jgi:hypothetical protein
MPDRKKVTVEPASKGWKVEVNGVFGDRDFEKKTQAIRYGREQAKGAELGQLTIKGQDGRIQREYTYGKDPSSRKG